MVSPTGGGGPARRLPRPAAVPPAGGPTVEVQAWRLEEHPFPVRFLPDGTWRMDPDYRPRDAAQADFLRQALTPQKHGAWIRERPDGTWERQKRDGTWAPKRPDGTWDPDTEPMSNPQEDLSLVDLLEILCGYGAGHLPAGLWPGRGGPTHGFQAPIGFPLALDAERRTLLAGAPEGGPRPAPLGEVCEAFMALPGAGPLVSAEERAAVLGFCRRYGFPFVPFEPLTVASHPLLLPKASLADLARARADLLQRFSTIHVSPANAPKAPPLTGLPRTREEYEALEGYLAAWAQRPAVHVPWWQDRLQDAAFRGRWFGFFEAFRVWQAALRILWPRAAGGLLGVADPGMPGRAEAEADVLRHMRDAAFVPGATVTPGQYQAATVAPSDAPRAPMAALLDAMLAVQETGARRKADSLPCQAPGCGARVRLDAQPFNMARRLGEPLEPLAFCRDHRGRQTTAMRAMCARHPQDEEARKWLETLKANQAGAQATRRKRQAPT